MSFHRSLALPLIYGLLMHVLSAHAEGLLSINNPAMNGLDRQFYVDGQAFEGNDSLAMSQYMGNWQGAYSPRDGENIGLLSARAESGVQWNGFRLGALYRAEALVRANRDATDLVRQYLTNNTFDYGRTYQIAYQLRGFEADGLRLSKSFQHQLHSGWQLNWGAGASLLQGKRLKLVTATGQALTLNAQDINVQANQKTHDSHMDTSGQGDFNPPYGAHPALSGQGWSVDLGLVMQHQDGLKLEAAVNDLYGFMMWQNLPQILASYNTSNKYYDAQGYVHFNPTGTSQSSYRNLTQTLDPKVWLAVSYLAGPLELQIASSFISGLWLPEIGVAYPLDTHLQLKASYDIRFETLGLTINHPWFYLGLRTQSIDFSASKAYGLSVGVRLEF